MSKNIDDLIGGITNLPFQMSVFNELENVTFYK